MANWRIVSAGAAALAMAAPASAGVLTGYLKLPDIEGESERSAGFETENIGVRASEPQAKPQQNREFNIGMPPAVAERDSGEAHLDYLVITMEAASANEAAHVVQQRAGTASADKEHEDWIPVLGVNWSRDVASGMPTGKRQHKPLSVTKELDKASPQLARSSGAGSAATSGGAGAGKASFKELSVTKKTDTATFLPPPATSGPGSVTLPANLPGCQVGKRYPHALVSDDGGQEVKLLDVSVTQCASEEVTLNYERIKWEY